MKRRALLSAVGTGSALVVAGCLADDDGSDTEDVDAAANASADTDSKLTEPSTAIQTDQCPAAVPDASGQPPAGLRSFVEEFEEAYAMEVDPTSGLQWVDVTIEETADEDGRARVDATTFLSESGWDGRATLTPYSDDDSTAESEDAGATNESGSGGGTSDEGGETLERVSASSGSLASESSLLDTIEDVAADGRSRTITDDESLSALTSAGDFGEFLIEHEDGVVHVENDADHWVGHGERYVGYFVTEDAVYRTEHGASAWNDRPDDSVVEVSDDGWVELECWS